MRFDILTLFPALFDSPFSISILGKAQEKSLISLDVHDIRRFAKDKHKTADDVPYGGGPGMVMKPEPIVECLESIIGARVAPSVGQAAGASPSTVLEGKKIRRIYFSPQGRRLQQSHLKDYLQYEQIVMLCGRYEGVDERVIEHFIDEEVSIGDYVLTGGEFAAMVFVDALSRLVPGVLGKEESLSSESFSDGSDGLLEYPQYTRPPEFRGHKVPDVLLSGDHQKIEAWRREQAISRTRKKRPDL